MLNYLDDRHLTSEHEHHTHLQQDPERVPDVVGVELLEALSTVTSLQQEGISKSGLSQPLLQASRLSCEHEGWVICENTFDFSKLLDVRVVWLLEGHLVPPADWGPILLGSWQIICGDKDKQCVSDLSLTNTT